MIDNGFISFFHEHFSREVILLIAMGASQADAEDATQEAMILAWRQWDEIREPAAWVRTVAIRSFWKHVRAQKNTTVALDEAVELVQPDAADLGMLDQEQQHVLRVFRALPFEQRVVAALFYDGLSCEEIAKLTKKSSATVRSHLRHARKTLKGLMLSVRLVRSEARRVVVPHDCHRRSRFRSTRCLHRHPVCHGS